MADPRSGIQALEALQLHSEGQHEEALIRAMELARANPDSVPVLSLAGPNDEAVSAIVSHHSRACTVDAFSAAAAASSEVPHCRGRNVVNPTPTAQPVNGPALKKLWGQAGWQRLGSLEEAEGHDEVARVPGFAFWERDQGTSNVAALTAMLDDDMYMGDKKAEWCSGA